MNQFQNPDHIDVIIKKYQLDITISHPGDIPSCFYLAIANGSGMVGLGSGETASLARRRAVMEWIERHVQFNTIHSDSEVIGRRVDLSNALDPHIFGLYSDAQYKTINFECSRYNDNLNYKWIPVKSLRNREIAYVPIEFIYPNARSDILPLVKETSSGTAASEYVNDALTAAVCEAIERDALMRWWYRQTPALVILPWLISSEIIQADLDALLSLGYIVTIARLEAVADLPCYVACALKGGRSWIGSACGLSENEAISHAVRELSQTILSFSDSFIPIYVPVDIKLVRNVIDHHFIYQVEPFSAIIREFFAMSFKTGDVKARRVYNEHKQISLYNIFQLLETENFDAFLYLSVLPEVDETIHVARVLIRGLIPFHIGFGNERLACKRLVERTNGERIRTFLPHCFA